MYPLRSSACLLLAAVGVLGVPRNVPAEWVVGAFLGHMSTRPSTVVLTLPTERTHLEIDDVTFRNESFTPPPHYGLRVGWLSDARPWIGADLEFIHNKVYAQTEEIVRMRGTVNGTETEVSAPLRTVVQRLSVSHGLNFLLANVAIRRGIVGSDSAERHRIALVVRGGAGAIFPHGESTIGGSRHDEYASPSLGAQATSGIEYLVWNGLGVTGEYKFTWAKARIVVPGGHATIPAATHHFVFGLIQRF